MRLKDAIAYRPECNKRWAMLAEWRRCRSNLSSIQEGLPIQLTWDSSLFPSYLEAYIAFELLQRAIVPTFVTIREESSGATSNQQEPCRPFSASHVGIYIRRAKEIKPGQEDIFINSITDLSKRYSLLICLIAVSPSVLANPQGESRLVEAAANWPSNILFVYVSSFLLSQGVSMENVIDIKDHSGLGLIGPVYALLASSLADWIRESLIRDIKCVIVDADNTLWAGIAGSDDYLNQVLGNPDETSGIKEFHSYLVSLRQKGLLLALVSKNNRADIEQILKRNSEIQIRMSDFVLSEIGWDPKGKLVERVRRRLSLADNELFVLDDDSSVLLEIRTSHPRSLCFRVSEDKSKAIENLNEIGLGKRQYTTKEDELRTRYYIEEAEREKMRSLTASPNDFLIRLELKVIVRSAVEADIDRLEQLSQRTHQFNVTGIYLDARKWRERIDDKNYVCLVAELSDRFGNYGLVGVCLIHLRDLCAEIESLMISCRAIGKGVESAILRESVNRCVNRRVETLSGSILNTPRNYPCREVYKDHGFTLVEQNVWRVSLSADHMRFPGLLYFKSLDVINNP